MVSHWTHTLNPEQTQAVLHDRGPMLVLAGAGSGKTTVLVHRCGRLIEEVGVEAKNILILTFTNKAAREIKHRVSQKLGAHANGVWAGTFHSFGLYVLKKYFREADLPANFGIIDHSDAMGIVKDLLVQTKDASKSGFDPSLILNNITRLREGRVLEGVDPNDQDISEAIAPKYESRLRSLGVTDFDGLLLKPIELFKSNPEILEQLQHQFLHLMVDEFQDTNFLQLNLVQRLAQTHENLTVVGDDDQSIYGWRGAEISNILNFPKLYKTCKTVQLIRNYRSHAKILNLANYVISKNKDRYPKKLIPTENQIEGELPELLTFEDDMAEAEGVLHQISYFHQRGFAYRDMCILYRSNLQGATLETVFRKNAVPYKITGGQGFFDRKEIKDVLAYLKTVVKPNELSLRRIINLPPRGLGDAFIRKIEEEATKSQLNFHAALRRIARFESAIDDNAMLSAFLLNLDQLKEKLLASSSASPPIKASEHVLGFLRAIGYPAYVRSRFKDVSSYSKRWELIEHFMGVMNAFVQNGSHPAASLTQFVETMELGDSLEGKEEDEDKVQLMTLHACKGLEFPIVILVGAEEELIPHVKLGQDVSEERRLLYVGLTRAQKRLLITHAKARRKRGRIKHSVISRFLADLPDNLVLKREGGFREITEDERQNLVKNLFAKIDRLNQSEV